MASIAPSCNVLGGHSFSGDPQKVACSVPVCLPAMHLFALCLSLNVFFCLSLALLLVSYTQASVGSCSSIPLNTSPPWAQTTLELSCGRAI